MADRVRGAFGEGIDGGGGAGGRAFCSVDFPIIDISRLKTLPQACSSYIISISCSRIGYSSSSSTAGVTWSCVKRARFSSRMAAGLLHCVSKALAVVFFVTGEAKIYFSTRAKKRSLADRWDGNVSVSIARLVHSSFKHFLFQGGLFAQISGGGEGGRGWEARGGG